MQDHRCERCRKLEQENERLRRRLREVERRLALARRATQYGLYKVGQVRERAHERLDQRSGVPPLWWQRAMGWDEASVVGEERLGAVWSVLVG